MHAWSDVEVPQVSTPSPAPRIHDSVSEMLCALDTGRDVTLYVCGITPYDATHMGHAATYVAFDTLIRVWRNCGANVSYAQNVTDVDDPLIERAAATGRDWQEIAHEQTELFRSDMEALRVIPPQHYIGAVESIPLVIERIHDLENAQATYRLGDDIYYDINHARTLGTVGHFSANEMRTIFGERGGDPERTGKHNPLDALLWRGETPNDPAWDSDFGRGRPGWHIECAAIALEYLGSTIDVQGGGSDLKFPHHEMSAAHAQTATGMEPFARVFMHTGMVFLAGAKMSKSLGNLVFVSQLLERGIDPMAIRLAILSNHYRSDWEWFDEDLEAAQTRLNLWRGAFECEMAASSVTDQVVAALSNDLDTPTALELIDRWATESLHGEGSSTSAAVHMRDFVDALLGIV
jgi:L-cysteine:1D-myo-inositol 2-amino-2-deoxy-alpha-D-glucopyranoside ligase